jgi:hypothetical protein
MALDYAALKNDNVVRYGTDIGRVGPMLLANRYDDRAHFIFELLQNAEDALKRRFPDDGSREVYFTLSEHALRFSHYGQLFTEQNVRGICGIGESTKSEDLTAIGRFGIGFKAVYAFTDSPEIHSGSEHFAIDSFVWPRAAGPIDLQPGETVFSFALRPDDVTAHQEIASGLQNLSVRTLLFLREIEEISWTVENGRSGTYLRSKVKSLDENTRHVSLIGQESESLEVVEEDWLIVSREVRTTDGASAGYIELGFALDAGKGGASSSLLRVDDSTLVVFFPTIVTTNLGFLIQGPYRTTPSRDNVPRLDSWNQHLVEETASLLVQALHKLREMGLLSVDALRALPIDRSKFGEGSMFAPLFDAVRTAFQSESLLPCFQGGYASSKRALLARAEELRELLDPDQLAALFGPTEKMFWLTEEITRDRTPELRQYLMRELQVSEIDPSTFLSKISKAFLEAQGDEWIVQFYGFLLRQPGVWRSGNLRDKPIIRLEDGRHVPPWIGGQPQAFLPGKIKTDFPTVKSSICDAPAAREFLTQIGLKDPDPVDDVVLNLLPKYRQNAIQFSESEYAADIKRIVKAFSSDSKIQREKLLHALRTSFFVAAVNTSDGSRQFVQPVLLYQATQRLKSLFQGVADILIVDDSLECLRGEDVRELLEACGAALYLQPVSTATSFNWEELAEMRRQAGAENNTGANEIEDVTLRGLSEVLATLKSLPREEAASRSAQLWDALCDVEDRRGVTTFSGTYRWFYYYKRSRTFDAAFVRLLNGTEWIPDKHNKLQRPSFVVFENLDPAWKQNPFLLSKIRFKPPLIEALAREAGIEPGLLDLLKKLGVTSEAELRSRLKIPDDETQVQEGDKAEDRPPDDPIRALLGDAPGPTPPIEDERVEFGDTASGVSGSGSRGGPPDGNGRGQPGSGHAGRRAEGSSTSSGKATSRGFHPTANGRPFISYIGSHPGEEETDPDGLTHEARMALEEKAIELICSEEPNLTRTTTNNPGFDLVEFKTQSEPIRWVEVKAMTGTLRGRPVCLSRTQFEAAARHGEAYWLYVVEQASSPAQARILRIQNPAGKARSFTFDQGWLSVAKVTAPISGEEELREE